MHGLEKVGFFPSLDEPMGPTIMWALLTERPSPRALTFYMIPRCETKWPLLCFIHNKPKNLYEGEYPSDRDLWNFRALPLKLCYCGPGHGSRFAG